MASSVNYWPEEKYLRKEIILNLHQFNSSTENVHGDVHGVYEAEWFLPLWASIRACHISHSWLKDTIITLWSYKRQWTHHPSPNSDFFQIFSHQIEVISIFKNYGIVNLYFVQFLKICADTAVGRGRNTLLQFCVFIYEGSSPSFEINFSLLRFWILVYFLGLFGCCCHLPIYKS